MPPDRKAHPAVDKLITELRRRRMSHGFTQKQMAVLMGTHQGLVAKVETRVHRDVTFWTLWKMADILGYELELNLRKREP
jgi:transcriptional regulator with XRE-family HTH domain